MTHRVSVATWTPERVEQLRTCVVNGLTCSQIAAEIGVTRNAIIGKIHRLGLKPLRSPGTPARACPPRAASPRFSQRKLLRLMFAIVLAVLTVNLLGAASFAINGAMVSIVAIYFLIRSHGVREL